MLYTTMAVAAWLVWRRGTGLPSGRSRGAMTVYGILLLVNLAWAPLFFGMYPMVGAAALWLALLLIAVHAVAAAATWSGSASSAGQRACSCCRTSPGSCSRWPQ